MIDFWNLHVCDLQNVERQLNEHAARGWSLHSYRSLGNPKKTRFILIFIRQFHDVSVRDRYLRDRVDRHHEEAIHEHAWRAAQPAPAAAPPPIVVQSTVEEVQAEKKKRTWTYPKRSIEPKR